MDQAMVMQGCEVTGVDVELTRSLPAAHLERGRTPLSQDVYRRWDWRNARAN